MSRGSVASLVAVGVLSMVGQVALLRELAVASFGVELLFLAGTAVWMAAGAAGAAAAGRGAGAGAGADADARAGTAGGFAALAVVLLAEVAFLRGARLLLGGVPGAYLPLGRQLATAALGLGPAAAVLGALFRRAAIAHGAAGGRLAAAYAWESLGGVAGSLLATGAAWAGAPNLALVVASAAASALLAARRRGARPAALALAALLAALLPLAPALDRRSTAWAHPHLADVADTPYGRVAVVEAEGQVVVLENDALVYDSEGTDAEPLVHAAALHVPTGARVLVLGGAATGLVREVLKHRPARVVAVEADEAADRLVRRRLPPADRAARSAPGVELRFEDPRAFLLRGAEAFDLVLVGAPEPSSGQTNRFYTVEFFRRCAARLAPGGVVALRLPSSENFWTPAGLLREAAVHAALREVFPDVLVVPGGADVLVASGSRLERDADVLAARLRARGVAAREVTPEWVRWVLTNDRTADLARRLAVAGAPANRDGRPVCYRQTALLWLGRVAGGAPDAALPSRGAALGALAAVALLVVAAAAARRGRRVLLVAVASMAGMMIEGVVLLRYQAEVGALYGDLGLLLTAFMAGLAAGAALQGRARRERAGPRRRSAVPVAGLAAVAAALAALVHAGAVTGLASSTAALAVTGALVGAVFAAAAGRPGEGGPGAGALYAADLLGGCAGSLLAAGLLVLVLGVDGTALGAGALAAAALLLTV